MFCSKCGRQLDEGRRFCTGCGSPIGTPIQTAAASGTIRTQPAQPPLQAPAIPPLPFPQPSFLPQAQHAVIDFSYAFRHAFQDRAWMKKCLTGGLYMILPVANAFLLMGYMAERIKLTAAAKDIPLPSMDLATHLKNGFLLFWKPLLIALVINAAAVGASLALSRFVPGFGVYLSLAIQIVASLFLFIYMTVCFSVISVEEKTAVSTDFRRILYISKTAAKPLLQVFLASILAYLLTVAGVFAFGIGVLFTAFIAYGFFYAHILGRFYVCTKRG